MVEKWYQAIFKTMQGCQVNGDRFQMIASFKYFDHCWWFQRGLEQKPHRINKTPPNTKVSNWGRCLRRHVWQMWLILELSLQNCKSIIHTFSEMPHSSPAFKPLPSTLGCFTNLHKITFSKPMKHMTSTIANQPWDRRISKTQKIKFHDHVCKSKPIETTDSLNHKRRKFLLECKQPRMMKMW